MERVSKPSMAGISLVSFIFIVAISLSYYQFVYIPALNAKPVVPQAVLHPPQTTKITIIAGSSQPSQTQNFLPKEEKVTLGLNNKVVWTNDDSTPHSVTSDKQYEDPINGKFNTLDTIGLIAPKATFEFTFTQIGEYAYHCEPHPWMHGKITVEKNFS